jgi:hypothetical protein
LTIAFAAVVLTGAVAPAGFAAEPASAPQFTPAPNPPAAQEPIPMSWLPEPICEPQLNCAPEEIVAGEFKRQKPNNKCVYRCITEAVCLQTCCEPECEPEVVHQFGSFRIRVSGFGPDECPTTPADAFAQCTGGGGEIIPEGEPD